MYGFLLLSYSNFVRKMHHFWDIGLQKCHDLENRVKGPWRSPTKKWGVEQVNPQSPQLSPKDDFICSDILRELTHHKTTRAFFEQPSFILQRIGDAGQVDEGGHGSVQ